MIGILTSVARTLMIDSGAPAGFWAEAFRHATDIYNNTAHACLNWSTPAHVLFSREPRLDFLRVFGSAAYVKRDRADKLGAQAEVCMYVGIDGERKGFRVWHPGKHRILTVWNVEFDEERFPWKERQQEKIGGGMDDETVFSPAVREKASAPALSLPRPPLPPIYAHAESAEQRNEEEKEAESTRQTSERLEELKEEKTGESRESNAEQREEKEDRDEREHKSGENEQRMGESEDRQSVVDQTAGGGRQLREGRGVPAPSF
jgi:hypothetical protein